MTDYALAFIHILPLITIDYLVDGEQVWSFMTRHAKIDSILSIKYNDISKSQLILKANFEVFI